MMLCIVISAPRASRSGLRNKRSCTTAQLLDGNACTVTRKFFLGKNFLVTVHALPSKSCAVVHERLLRNPDLLARGAEMTMHNIIDQSVDAYFPLVEDLNVMVDG